MDLIENLGDAHEALEMMFFMIAHLSGGDQRKIKASENAYYASLRASPRS